jgi:hypothetical protein
VRVQRCNPTDNNTVLSRQINGDSIITSAHNVVLSDAFLFSFLFLKNILVACAAYISSAYRNVYPFLVSG